MRSHAFAQKLVACLLLASSAARAGAPDVDASIQRHADEVVSALDLASLSREQKQHLRVSHLAISAGLLVPVFGSWRLESQVFGQLKVSGILGDWVAGGVVPAGLAMTAWLAGGRLTDTARLALLVTSLGLYVITRIAVLIIGNDHVSVYNRFLTERLGLDGAPAVEP